MAFHNHSLGNCFFQYSLKMHIQVRNKIFREPVGNGGQEHKCDWRVRIYASLDHRTRLWTWTTLIAKNKIHVCQRNLVPTHTYELQTISGEKYEARLSSTTATLAHIQQQKSDLMHFEVTELCKGPCPTPGLWNGMAAFAVLIYSNMWPATGQEINGQCEKASPSSKPSLKYKDK